MKDGLIYKEIKMKNLLLILYLLIFSCENAIMYDGNKCWFYVNKIGIIVRKNEIHEDEFIWYDLNKFQTNCSCYNIGDTLFNYEIIK